MDDLASYMKRHNTTSRLFNTRQIDLSDEIVRTHIAKKLDHEISKCYPGSVGAQYLDHLKKARAQLAEQYSCPPSGDQGQ